MASSMEPSEDVISQIIDIAGLDPVGDRPMVINALKSNTQSLALVLEQYFENPDKFRNKYTHKWDDTVFAGERDGTDNSTGISFHVESPSQNDLIQRATPPPMLGAPSRPPSRANSRSPLGRIADWSAATATGAPTSHSQEDEDMARALRASAQEAGIEMPEQESGVTGATGTHFGPASGNDYDHDNWAMVPSTPAETRIGHAPPAFERKRAPKAPAFLVQGLTTDRSHRLGSLLTILHEIPLVRNELLEIGEPAATYGHNSEWWNGQEILPPHILAQLQSGELTWGADNGSRPKFEEETHRLMAFLDATERSYGTVSVLADVIPWPSEGHEKQFYELLSQRASEVTRPIYQTAVITSVIGDVQDEEARFGLLEVNLPRVDWGFVATLYDAINYVMWSDAFSALALHEESRMAMFTSMGEVLAIKFAGEGPANSIDVPLELYPERWLSTRKEEARRMQVGMCYVRKALLHAIEARKLLVGQREGDSQTSGDGALVAKIEDQWKALRDYTESSSRFRAMTAAGFDTTKYPDYRAAPSDPNEEEKTQLQRVDEMLRWAEKAKADLDRKMVSANERITKLMEKQSFLSELLTDPNKPGRPKPMTCNKYLLRGVATKHDTVYVCRRTEPDLIDVDEEPRKIDQWWRLAYEPLNDVPVVTEKVEAERVLRDMWTETKTPILVYATEAACSANHEAVSSALDRFVRADNKAFRQELKQTTSAEAPFSGDGADASGGGSMNLKPLSPSKRKHRSDSPDSLDSNRASIGSDGRGGFDNPFLDQDSGVGTEMADSHANFAAPAAAMEPFDWRQGETRATTVTAPQTIAPEDLDLSRPGSVTQLPTVMEEESRAPEMQERVGPSPFVSLSRTTSGEQDARQPDALMDMDMPGQQG